MPETKRLFDRSKTFTVPIRGGMKTCKLRFPTDEQWKARDRARPIIQHSLAAGRSEMDVPNAARANAELFAKVRADEGEKFDDAEASLAIGRLEDHDITAAARAGSDFSIEVSILSRADGTYWYTTRHLLRMPTVAETHEYSRRAVRMIDTHRAREIRTSLEASGDLYDKLLKSADGYANEAPASVPVIHKDTVITEVLRLVAKLDSEADPCPED